MEEYTAIHGLDFIQNLGTLARKLLVQSAVSVCICIKSTGEGKGQTLAILSELVGKVLCCVYTTYFTVTKGLLTEQALLVTYKSLFGQQAWAFLCKHSCSMPALSLRKVDITSRI
ncbi:TPA: hypothetical protein ACH3X2_009861 [Trebouxia sp. C0005]